MMRSPSLAAPTPMTRLDRQRRYEIAAVIVDTADCKLRELGIAHPACANAWFCPQSTSSLWSKHFGFDVGKVPYFRSFQRPIGSERSTIHPPRVRTNPVLIKDAGQEFSEVLDKPCDPKTIATIQAIARNNLALYEQVLPGCQTTNNSPSNQRMVCLTFIANKIESTWDGWTGEKASRSFIVEELSSSCTATEVHDNTTESVRDDSNSFIPRRNHSQCRACYQFSEITSLAFSSRRLGWGKTKTNGDPEAASGLRCRLGREHPAPNWHKS